MLMTSIQLVQFGQRLLLTLGHQVHELARARGTAGGVRLQQVHHLAKRCLCVDSSCDLDHAVTQSAHLGPSPPIGLGRVDLHPEELPGVPHIAFLPDSILGRSFRQVHLFEVVGEGREGPTG